MLEYYFTNYKKGYVIKVETSPWHITMTVKDIMETPEEQIIALGSNGVCAFCGKRLKLVGFGPDKFRQFYSEQYYPCTCEAAVAAAEHNNEAVYLQNKRRTQKQEEQVVKTITITAEELLSVSSGRILPNADPREAEDKISDSMRVYVTSAGLKSAKECLMAYAEQKGFKKALESATKELVEFITLEGVSRISAKITEICGKYNLPRVITL